MLYTACKQVIADAYENGIICHWRKKSCEWFINQKEFHVQLRNQIMLIPMPKSLEEDSSDAHLRIALLRVNFLN